MITFFSKAFPELAFSIFTAPFSSDNIKIMLLIMSELTVYKIMTILSFKIPKI